MIFVYCETCGLRIPNEDVEAKTAVQLDTNRWLCSKCGVANAASPTSEVQPVARPASESKRVITPVTGSIVTAPDSKRKNTPAGGITAVVASAAPSARAAAPQKKPFPLIPVAGGAATVLTLAAVFFALHSVEEQPVATKRPTPPVPAIVEVAHKEEAPPAQEPTRTVVDVAATNSGLGTTVPPVTPTTVAAGAPQTEVKVKFTEELEKMRNERAQALLDEAVAYAEQKPSDIKGQRKKLELVLRSYRSTPAGEEATKKLADIQQPAIQAPLDETAFANALDAFPYVDIKEDKSAGEWAWENGALKISTGRYMIPYDPGGEYDVRFAFTRVKSGSSFGVVLRPDGGKQFLFVIFPDDRVGFSKIGGKSAVDNPSTVHLGAPLATTKHTAVVQVRKTGVRAFVDGQFATQYETNFADLCIPADHTLKNGKVLGLYSDNSVALFHSFEIAEINGKGRFTHAAVSKTETPAPEVPAATVGAIPEAPKSDPVAILKSETSAYESVVWPAFALAAKDGVSQAKARLETARKDAAFASHAAALGLDLQIVAALETLDQAALKGVEVLADKRTFKFDRLDGKTTGVGKGFKLNVKGVKNGKLILEERMGGASAESQLDMEVLTLACRMELARLGVGSTPEGASSLAAGFFLASLVPNSPITDAMVTTQSENAARLKAPAELLEHLKNRQAALAREREADHLLAEAREFFEAKKNDDAKTRLASFLAAAADTATGERAQEEVRNMLVELKARELRPGLWYTYYSGNNSGLYQKKLLARAELKLRLPATLPKDVPKDYWAIRAGGILRVETPGSYVFQVTVDDHATFSINDLKAGEIRNKKDATFSATLKAGDNALRFNFEQMLQSFMFTVKWKVPGAADFTDIPDNVLWYDPGKVPAYEQGP